MKDETITLLEEGLEAYARSLVKKAKMGDLSAADGAQLRGLYKESGGMLSFADRPSSAGQTVLDVMADLDPGDFVN